MSLAETYKKVRGACVALAIEFRDERGIQFFTFGSGVCVDKKGVIITARHVITGYYESIKCEKISGNLVPSRPEFQIIFTRYAKEKVEGFFSRPLQIAMPEDKDCDVAIIRIPEINNGWPFLNFPSHWKIFEGDDVATAGYPLRSYKDPSVQPNLFRGIVSRIPLSYVAGQGWRADELIVDISIHPGNSGGPVFDVETGELLGIVSNQVLRSVDTSGLTEIPDSFKDLSKKTVCQFNVWTNIVSCVPWIRFSNLVDKFKTM